MAKGHRSSQWRCSAESGALRCVGAEVEEREASRAQSYRQPQRERESRGSGPLLRRRGGLIITNIYTHVWTVGPRDRSYVDNSYFRQAYKNGFTFKMPILLFLLDTSASMNQRTYLGTTYLDIAKGAVEVFMKVKNDLTPTFFSQRAPLQSLGSSARLVGINICCFGFLLFLTAACPRPG